MQLAEINHKSLGIHTMIQQYMDESKGNFDEEME
jgi:hypothetical protein